MLMPQATLRIMKGGGHLVLADSAEQVGPVITSFLQGDADLRVPGYGGLVGPTSFGVANSSGYREGLDAFAEKPQPIFRGT